MNQSNLIFFFIKCENRTPMVLLFCALQFNSTSFPFYQIFWNKYPPLGWYGLVEVVRIAGLHCAHIHDGSADRKKAKMRRRWLLKTPGADHIKKLSPSPQPATLRRNPVCRLLAHKHTQRSINAHTHSLHSLSHALLNGRYFSFCHNKSECCLLTRLLLFCARSDSCVHANAVGFVSLSKCLNSILPAQSGADCVKNDWMV